MTNPERVIVTGAASGVGAATVSLLLDRGAQVLGVDIHGEGGDARPGYEYAQCDVRDRDEAHALFGSFAASGGLTGLITSAAVYGRDIALDDLRPDDVDHVLGVNVAGTLWCVQAAMPHLRESHGSVVCVASLAGRIGGVLAGAHYSASKGALLAMVRSIAKNEMQHGVRVNGVAPGPIDTPMIAGRGYKTDMFPIGRFASPEEIARPILFLLGADASYATGVVLDVNGGVAFS
ncbi:SDR family oxidoreductase [Nocardioides immobilis]|uniref:SDR family oxidoreductase n=1 Tax=Nocardioides immobilis TaxID=2049295 RepID=A0A417Y751_9ACTN|nr:SDR family oxidoreductase [Nocardioides immobilis]RHW28397.1 SDR family oxidoreductase [Nocardioides immobilis]